MPQLEQHYVLEKQLARELRLSTAAERGRLYRDVYERLFAALPHHPQHTAKSRNDDYVEAQVETLDALVAPDSAFVEIGAGDGRLTRAMASRCRSVVAVDVTPAVLVADPPANFTFVQTDGTHLALPDASVDFVYSNQLMEHLHPDDAREQLNEITRILAPGGRYLCITPNIHSGPHDISKFFDVEATGLHLQEYSYRSLARTFRAAGFRRVTPLILRRRRAYRVPLGAAALLEVAVGAIDRLGRRSLRWLPQVRALLGVVMLAEK